MTVKQTNTLMDVLLGMAAFAVILGAILQLQHYPYGKQIVYFGLIASLILSSIEISRLKKRIKVLEKETEKTE